ncbi:AAA family ATPase [Paracoccus zeaxanthinifaciens]|uniref:AAA family ATPase n=1 Tax=Paracoccus zeaxanthinifaciens TaxID=187400 RepID=UPI0003B703CD|nr:AAA family ATPase [Paracoccus zeaxanthinifaciens]
MRLRSIALTNVRQFTGTVRIDGFQDGLNVLSEPNEFGKSTLFDAIHAVFFKAHGSADKEIKALRPHSGGAPEIAVEIELPDGRFTITKRWMQKPAATVTRGGTMIAQSDAAEDWIARCLGQDAGGPAGLIWVRQGMTSLVEAGKAEKAAGLEARRDLLSSVGEEVEAMTGGRRMDDALRRCREELRLYATDTGRVKANGPWRAAQDRVADLTVERERLSRLADDLHGALARRQTARRELAELTDPEAVAARAKRLEVAQAEHAAAERHAAEMDRLGGILRTARLQADSAQRRLADLDRARVEQQQSAQLLADADLSLADAQAAYAEARDALDAAQAELDAATATLQRTEAERQRADRAHAARQSAALRKDLTDRIALAEAARTQQEQARARIGGVTQDQLARIEDLSLRLATADAARRASATQITASYSGAARLQLDGAQIEDGTTLPLSRVATIAMPGIGQLTIRPAQGGDDQAHEDAAKALRDALAALDVTDLAAARASAAARAQAERQQFEAAARLAGIAPDGLDALRSQLAALPEDRADPDAPVPTDAAAAHDAARQAETLARATRDARAGRLAELRDTLTRAEMRQAEIQGRLTRATDSLAGFEDADAIAGAAQDANAALALAHAELERAGTDAPDLAGCKAALTRARSVDEGARSRTEQIRVELATLDERIDHASGEAVEERLTACLEELDFATGELQRIDHEVAVLQRLETALTAARTEARERYFEPIARELRPLLALLWPDADLSWSEDSLLPDALIRDGRPEPLDILSGGTQEQIALLVRLAFARLLGNAGRSAPVILDDALVFTDDERIERMFDALHRQAADLQIIVLTCRQRAFRDLGGQSLRLMAEV